MAVMPAIKINTLTLETPSPVCVMSLITNQEIKQDKNGKDYLMVEAMDNTGKLTFRCFDHNTVIPGWKTILAPGSFVKIQFNNEVFNGASYPKITKVRNLSEQEVNDAGGKQGFIYSAPEKIEDMMEEFCGYIKKTGIYEGLIDDVLGPILEKFKIAPAAKLMHHAFYGGTLFHTLSMLRTAEKMASIYPLNTQLMFAGVILHDTQKAIELEYDEYGSCSGYTVPGQLLGHIGLIVEKVSAAYENRKADGLPIPNEEGINLLYHCLLSHHGKLEFGSPIRPAIPEAMAISFIDDFDAKISSMFMDLTNTAPGTISATVKVLGYGVYKPSLTAFKVENQETAETEIATEVPASVDSTKNNQTENEEEFL